MLTVAFDQTIKPGPISADNFRAQIVPTDRWSNDAHMHPGGSVLGPMATTMTSPGLVPPGLVFRNSPADEVANATTGSVAAFSNFAFSVVP